MIYVLDTNTVTDYLRGIAPVVKNLSQAVADNHTLCLSQPVDYEIRRGLIKKRATRQLHNFQNDFIPLITWTQLTDADWLKAADLWAEMRNRGRQFSDVDLLLAAITLRLEGTLVSADDDFSALTVSRENWRITDTDN
jgi:predicted nucleic acid-binding protein